MRQTIMKWFGGKYYLLGDILPFPQHDLFVDVFGGSGVVILNKIPAIRDIYNDINKNLFNLFLSLKNNFDRFIFASKIYDALDSRAIWEWGKSELEKDGVFLDQDQPFDINLYRSVIFYYMQCLSFSGSGKDFHGVDSKMFTSAFRVYNHKIDEVLKDIYQVIKRITFECQDFHDLLKREPFHEPNCLLYMDPPYIVGGQMYEKIKGGVEWKEEYLFDMADLVRDTNAYVCISIDCSHEKLGLTGSKWNSQKILRLQRANILEEDSERGVGIEYIIRNYDQKSVPKMKLNKEKSLKEFFMGKGGI